MFKTGTTVAHDPENKILGIVGMGGIGRALAKRALAFDMKVQYHNRNQVDPSLLASFVSSSHVRFAFSILEILPLILFCSTFSITLLNLQPTGSVTYVPTLEELLATSDCVSLNLPLNANTVGFFGKTQFDQMKKGAILVNTARGGVVNEEDMLDALESGHVCS